MPASHLEHLSDLPPGQVDIEPAHELMDLLNAQQAIPILVSLLEGLLHPCAIRSRSMTELQWAERLPAWAPSLHGHLTLPGTLSTAQVPPCISVIVGKAKPRPQGFAGVAAHRNPIPLHLGPGEATRVCTWVPATEIIGMVLSKQEESGPNLPIPPSPHVSQCRHRTSTQWEC